MLRLSKQLQRHVASATPTIATLHKSWLCTEASKAATTFKYGDTVVVRELHRGRLNALELAEGAVYECGSGSVPHAAFIEAGPAVAIRTNKQKLVVALEPTPEEWILSMPRASTPTYPKDCAHLCMLAGIKCGDTVLEAGTGSGGSTVYFASVVGPTGRVISLDRRQDHSTVARRNVRRFFGQDPPYVSISVGDVASVDLPPASVDAVVLDLMEPWETPILDMVERVLKPGGRLATYLPNVPQVVQLYQVLRHRRNLFTLATVEVGVRYWDIAPPAARPAHLSGRHSAFLSIVQHLKMPPPLKAELEQEKQQDEGVASGVDASTAAETADNSEAKH